ncbi:MAG: YdcF family protein [Erysipelotrichaceae bacterium]|nr:YdcF family protein [Erysipelotrichaceae bacterium]
MNAFFLPAVLWGIFLVSFLYNRSRLRNCFYFTFAAIATIVPAVSLVGGKAAPYVLLVIAIAVAVIILDVPFFLIANGVTMMKKESRSLANRLSLFFGIFILAGEMAFLYTFLLPSSGQRAVPGGISRVIIFFGLSVFYLSCIFVTFLLYTRFIEHVPHTRDFDFLIVHGSGLIHGNQVSKLLADRLDKAIEVYNKDRTKPKIITSGGQGPDETVSEAHAMAMYLCEHGVPASDVIEEDQSPDTMTNVINSKKIIDASEGRKRTALISSNYHVYRCMMDARRAGLRCIGIGSHTASYYWPSALIREFVAVFTRPLYLTFLILGWLPICIICFA